MHLTTREMTAISLFAALHIAAAVLLRFGGEVAVPFSLVPFFVLLSGLFLGRKGAISLLVYTLLGLLGVPVFAKAPFGGLSYCLQPSFGYVLGYLLAALVTGWLVERMRRRSVPALFGASVVGLAALYLCGLPYIYLTMRFILGKSLSLTQVLAVGFFPFIGLDLAKALLASALAASINRRLPRIVSRQRTI